METNTKRWNKEELRVVGRLKFQRMREDQWPAATFFEAQIRQADELNPWVSKSGDEHEPWVTIEEDTASCATLTIVPQFAVFSRQLDAFHQYLCQIAERIADLDIDELAWVAVSMTVTDDAGGLRFLTRAGQEIANKVEGAVMEVLSAT